MHTIGTFLGLFGMLKYAIDRTTVENLHKFHDAIRTTLSQSGKMSREEQNKLVVEMGARMWSSVVDDPAKKNITLFSKVGSLASSLYCYMVPGFLRSVLFAPTYILTYPLRLLIDKRKMEVVRSKARKMAVEGLWSFMVPMALAIITAAILVQEVHYVRVVNGQGPTGPEIKKHTVRRVVIGPGRFSFSLPYHPIIYSVSYLLVLFAVFHTCSFILLLANYEKES